MHEFAFFRYFLCKIFASGVDASIADVGWELFYLMLEVVSGRKKTWTEHWKLHNALVLFNPAPVT